MRPSQPFPGAPAMSLPGHHKRHLRGLAHHLKPVVIVGQAGLTDPVLAEAGLALDSHELIKVKVNAADRDIRTEIIERLTSEMGAELIQRIGQMAVLFRRNPERPRIQLPAA